MGLGSIEKAGKIQSEETCCVGDEAQESLFDIPIWRRYVLTIVEAAVYYHIGEKKLRAIVDEHPNAEFFIMNGNRVLIKKGKFEEFLDAATVV